MSKTIKKSLVFAAATPLWLWATGAAALTPLEDLGKHVFFDTISRPEDAQSCASCHDLSKGGILPDSTINSTTVVAPGAQPKRLGNLKPPSNTYASFSPPFQPDPLAVGIPLWKGGNFWDGRAEGYGAEGAPGAPQGDGGVSNTITVADLGSHPEYKKFLGPTADQALNPFPNKVEQSIRVRQVCKNVKDSSYNYLYKDAFGEAIDCKAQPVGTDGNVPFMRSYKRIAVSLAAYQASNEVNSFSSKRDKALKNDSDDTPGKFPLKGLTAQENLGHDLFYTVTNLVGPGGGVIGPAAKAGNCAICHNSGNSVFAGPFASDGTEPEQLYTDQHYHHIGVPYNREIPVDGKKNSPALAKGEKKGLTAHVTDEEPGHFRTPTLRNVGRGTSKNFTKAYAHNGWFKSLESIVHFYNTRDVLPKCESLGIVNATEKEAKKNNCWPQPEFVNGAIAPQPIIGDLGLTSTEEAAIVAYLKSLSDTNVVKKPKY